MNPGIRYCVMYGGKYVAYVRIVKSRLQTLASVGKPAIAKHQNEKYIRLVFLNQ